MSSTSIPFKQKLRYYVDSSYPLLWVQTHEETRVVGDISDAFFFNPEGGKPPRTIYQWDAIRGLTKLEPNKLHTALADTAPIKKLLEAIEKSNGEQQLFLLKDFHPYFQEPAVRRAFRNILGRLKSKSTTVIFISPVCNIPEELIKEIQIVEYALPTEKAIRSRLEFVHRAALASSSAAKNPADFVLSEDIALKAVEAGKGLTDGEVENAFTLALVENKKFDDGFVRTVFGEKVTQVKKNGLLTYLEPDVTFEQVGGLDGLKIWIKQRALAYTPKAREYGLPYPKGMLLCGIPGTGKTLLAKATAAELKLPLFQLDVGGLFGKMVGETEQNFRRVIQIVDGIGSCILFID